MKQVLQLFSLMIFLTVFIGTGYILVTKGGMPFLWQMFWIGFIIWIWGMIILSRFKDKERGKTSFHHASDVNYAMHKKQLDLLKTAAVSALVSITFFYSSISWIFRDNIAVSLVILLVTFYVSFMLQTKILDAAEKEED